MLVNGNGNLDMDPRLQFSLGFEDLSMMSSMRVAGSTVGSMVQYASLALEAGLVDYVVLVYGDTPLRPAVGAGAAYAARGVWDGMNVLKARNGEFGGNILYALAARRHMEPSGRRASSSAPSPSPSANGR